MNSLKALIVACSFSACVGKVTISGLPEFGPMAAACTRIAWVSSVWRSAAAAAAVHPGTDTKNKDYEHDNAVLDHVLSVMAHILDCMSDFLGKLIVLQVFTRNSIHNNPQGKLDLSI